MATKFHLVGILCLIQALTVAADFIPCQNTCNNVPIYFPFGIGEGCYMNASFEVICNSSFSPPKLFLPSINMEIDYMTRAGQVRVKNPVISSNCNDKTSSTSEISLSGTPFVYSSVDNRFVATGCNNYAMLVDGQMGDTIGGCLSFCPNGAYSNGSGCYGVNCCEASIPPNIQSFRVNMTNPLSYVQDRGSCKSAFMVDRDLFAQAQQSSRLGDLNQLESVPAILDWANDQGYCDMSRAPNVRCTLDSTYCWKQLNMSQFCICSQCQNHRKCTVPGNYNNCKLYCLYTPGGYRCPCPPGHGYIGNICLPDHVIWGKSQTKTKSIAIGVSSGFGLLLLLMGLWLSYKLIKRKQEQKLKQKFFKRNGGLLLEQQLSSTDTHVEQTKLFTSKELETATDNYHMNRILGQGGQGTVTKEC